MVNNENKHINIPIINKDLDKNHIITSKDLSYQLVSNNLKLKGYLLKEEDILNKRVGYWGLKKGQLIEKGNLLEDNIENHNYVNLVINTKEHNINSMIITSDSYVDMHFIGNINNVISHGLIEDNIRVLSTRDIDDNYSDGSNEITYFMIAISEEVYSYYLIAKEIGDISFINSNTSGTSYYDKQMLRDYLNSISLTFKKVGELQ